MMRPEERKNRSQTFFVISPQGRIGQPDSLHRENTLDPSRMPSYYVGPPSYSHTPMFESLVKSGNGVAGSPSMLLGGNESRPCRHIPPIKGHLFGSCSTHKTGELNPTITTGAANAFSLAKS